MRHLTDRQREILDAALGIIADHGIQRMTIKNLARAVNVTEPALYRHFKSKFDILMTILIRYRDDLQGCLTGRTGGLSPVETIESIYNGMFSAFVKQPALSVVIFSEELFRYDRRLSQEVTSIIELPMIAFSIYLRKECDAEKSGATSRRNRWRGWSWAQ